MRRLHKKADNHRTPCHGGFSLIELMVVIAILAITSAIAVPNILAYRQNSQMRAAASETLGTFRKAQVYAVKNNYNTCIVLTPAANTINVFSDNGSGGGGIANDSTQNGSEPTIITFNLPPATNLPGAKITFTGNKTGFTPRGLPLGGGMGSAEIHSASGSADAIYKISLSIAGHTRLEVSTNGGGSWQ